MPKNLKTAEIDGPTLLELTVNDLVTNMALDNIIDAAKIIGNAKKVFSG